MSPCLFASAVLLAASLTPEQRSSGGYLDKVTVGYQGAFSTPADGAKVG